MIQADENDIAPAGDALAVVGLQLLTRSYSFVPEKPRQWSPTPLFRPNDPTLWNLDLAPDGKRFVVTVGPEVALLSVIHAAGGPKLYARLAVISETTEAMSKTTVAHRFTATKKPMKSPIRNLAHW